jgi:hypothetical protein
MNQAMVLWKWQDNPEAARPRTMFNQLLPTKLDAYLNYLG